MVKAVLRALDLDTTECRLLAQNKLPRFCKASRCHVINGIRGEPYASFPDVAHHLLQPPRMMLPFQTDSAALHQQASSSSGTTTIFKHQRGIHAKSKVPPRNHGLHPAPQYRASRPQPHRTRLVRLSNTQTFQSSRVSTIYKSTIESPRYSPVFPVNGR